MAQVLGVINISTDKNQQKKRDDGDMRASRRGRRGDR